MSFHIEPGRILITDAGGTPRFDSDEPLFHTINEINGTQAIAAYSNTGDTYKDITTSYLIGSCNAACTHLIGAVKFKLNSYAAGCAFDRWTTIMGGTTLWLLAGTDGQQGYAAANSFIPRQIVYYSFRIDGTDVYLDRRIILGNMATGVTFTVLSHSIEYHLEAGLFT